MRSRRSTMRIVTLVNSSDVIIFSFFPSFFLQYFETRSHIVSFKVSLTLNPPASASHVPGVFPLDT